MKEAREGLIGVFTSAFSNAKSDEMKGFYKMVGAHLYLTSRWILASVVHPIATFKAVMLIGDQETINRNIERALSLPKLPRGSNRFKP